LNMRCGRVLMKYLPKYVRRLNVGCNDMVISKVGAC